MSFGHTKEVCLPPECLVDVYADVTLPNCAKRLDYPITLQGALALRKEPQPPKLCVTRILKEKGNELIFSIDGLLISNLGLHFIWHDYLS